MSTASSWPRVRFAIRYPAGDDTWRYEPVDVGNPGGQGFTALEYPPATGDLISLWDRSRHARGLPPLEGGPGFRVLDRSWHHSSYGSMDWPYGEQVPRSGPLLDIIVEPADGPYRDEAPICAESTCEAKYLFGQWQLPPGAGEASPHAHEPYEHVSQEAS
jgi:hypothetical protein